MLQSQALAVVANDLYQRGQVKVHAKRSGHVYRRPRPKRKAKAKRKSRLRGAQMIAGNVGQMMLTASALVAVFFVPSAPTVSASVNSAGQNHGLAFEEPSAVTTGVLSSGLARCWMGQQQQKEEQQEHQLCDCTHHGREEGVAINRNSEQHVMRTMVQ